jgi:hypothetical protein
MPQEEFDSGDEESDSYHDADLATLEELGVSEEHRQEAIDRVDFDRCELVREVGERYRDGESVPVIAAEAGEPMMTVEEAVKTYYLVFGEPPIYVMSIREFQNGRRFFVDGCDVADLEAETQNEAEEHVRAFVGRTLMDNDLDVVDIESPVPEMESFFHDELAEMGQTLAGFEWRSAGPSLHMDMVEQARKNLQGLGLLLQSSVMRDIQNVAEELTRTTIPEIDRLIRPSFSTMATGSVLASSAAMSSLASTPMGTGLEPSAIQLLNQPELQEAVRKMQTLPVREINRSLAQQAELASEIVEQADGIHLGVSGVGATMLSSAVVTPNGTDFFPARPEDVIRQFETSQVQSESAQIKASTEMLAWFDERFDIPSPKEHALFYIGIAEFVLTLLRMEYPGHHGLMIASPVSKLVLGVYIYMRYYG